MWALKPWAWIVFYLLALDVVTNAFFAYPTDPRHVSPTRLQRYFEYGRSVEGKLARMTRRTLDESAPIVQTGWLTGNPLSVIDCSAPGAGPATVTFYGMSHANLLAKEVARQDRSLGVRAFAAPAAVATWAFAAFLRDREKTRSDAVVLTVMTNTIALLTSTAGGTMYFDGAYPYAWPRYTLDRGALTSISPPFTSWEGFRDTWFDSGRWREYRQWLAANDKYYDPILYRSTPLDRSALFRLARRSYALASRRAKQARVYDDYRGFNPSSEEVAILEAIVAEFAATARGDGSHPILVIVNSLNGSDHAFRLLRPTLTRLRVPYLSSHEVIDPGEPRNYQSDSHFVPAMNERLARKMRELLHAELDESPGRAKVSQ